ncbi:MAG: hypothetical protein U5K31_05645 [Balneolaceae bacterium]|nr:hypothetical protein [Balneolaceae bacterium]
MYTVLNDDGIPWTPAYVLNYRPQSSKRIDFIIGGQNEEKVDHAIIVELKQMETAEKTRLDMES